MKPGRLQNALKSFGRASKCFKILWPGLINPENFQKNPRNFENPRGFSKKTEKFQEPPVFFANFPEFSTIFTLFFGQRAKFPQKRCFFRQHKHGSFGGPHRGAAATAPGSGTPVRDPPPAPPRFNSATTKVAAVSINFPTSTFYFLLYLTPSTSYLLLSASYSTFLLQHPTTYYLLHYPSINKPGGRSGGGRHFL